LLEVHAVGLGEPRVRHRLVFLGGQGPAPSYVMSLSEEKRVQLRERLRDSLPFAIDGSIPLVARAWAVRGFK
jgi:hypothetical protein